MSKLHALLAILTISIIGMDSSAAADFQYIEDPSSLVGKSPGVDGLWGSTDDFSVFGLNSLGDASTFLDSKGNFGFFGGTFKLNAGGAVSYGVNSLSLYSGNGEVSSFFNSPYTQAIDSSVTNTVNIGTDNTATGSFGVVQMDSFGGAKTSVVGSYTYLQPGQNPSVIFSGQTDLINHYKFLLTLVPSDWTVLGTGFDSFEYTAGVNLGATGVSSVSWFSNDPDAALAPVPVPPALFLLGSALAALVSVRRKTT